MGIAGYLILSSALFSLGVFGLVTRKNAVGLLAAVELMANGVNLNFVAFSRFLGGSTGQVFALFSTAITVAEVVVGLALVIVLFRARGDVSLGLASELKG
ncbi:MAG: NADH-quinone oxidoreductase subunit NuoK [Deltaproteobacteria bacterium]|nr:NADH-quinone oxidoreductase subunit NuoK [Deltaproteobacteria bacterium]